jgi:hypothetical protein
VRNKHLDKKEENLVTMEQGMNSSRTNWNKILVIMMEQTLTTKRNKNLDLAKFIAPKGTKITTII